MNHKHSRLTVVLLPLLFTLIVAACGTATALNSSSASKASCQSLSSRITATAKQLTAAKKKAESKDSKGTPAEKPALAKVKQLQGQLKSLKDKREACKAAETTTSTKKTKPKSKAHAKGKVKVKDAAGHIVMLPIISGNTPVVADSTHDKRTPASIREEKKNGPLKSWADAYKRLGKFDYYVKGLNDRKASTGFDWNDVKRFATTKGVEARAITIINWPGLTDQKARDDVRGLIGNDADKLRIVRINNSDGCVDNTRGFLDHAGMEDFCDPRSMVRVSLLPIIYNAQGKPIGLSDKSGIFVDCFNIWRIVKIVTPPPAPVHSPPSTHPPHNTVPGTPPTTLSHCQQTGKCTPANTVPAPPVTSRPPKGTSPPTTTGGGNSGNGSTNTSSPPTTTETASPTPTTGSPTTNPPTQPGK